MKGTGAVGLIEKPVGCRYGHAIVMGRGFMIRHWGCPGRHEDLMIQSQENCLSVNHHLTYEGWGRGFCGIAVINKIGLSL